MHLYSRNIYIHHPGELTAGDLVDVSITVMPSWAPVDHVGACADDESDEVDCDSSQCRGVVFFADEAQMSPYHVGQDDEVYARLRATDSQDDVDAENAAHAAAAAADYAARLAGVAQ